VKRVFKDSVIEIKDSEKLLKTYKREHMAPGEMEHIVLPKAILESANGSLVISVKEEISHE
jgi:hypothetical protein